MKSEDQTVTIVQTTPQDPKQSSKELIKKDLNGSVNKSDTELEAKKEDLIIYKESPYRFVIVITYCLLCFANGFQWVTFSSSAAKFGIAYNLSTTQVNIFSLLYMILYPFLCIPEGYLVDNYSTRLGLIIAASATLIGAALKCLVNISMEAVYFGQFLAAALQPMILNSPGRMAANWFRVNARTLVTTICCISNTIGILFGFVFHTFIIDEEVEGEVYKEQFFNYVFWEFILNVIFCLPSFFILRNKPLNPPSPSQERKEPSLCVSLKLLFTNKNFYYLLISSCFVIGYYNVFGTILNAYLFLYNITDAQSSYIYALSSGLGIFSSLGISALLDKYKKFKLIIIILSVSGCVLQIMFTFLLELSLKDHINQYAVGMVMYTLVTAVLIPIYTIGMNYVCEITYPVGESLTGGIMMSVSQISGIAGTFACDALILHYPNLKFLTNIVLLIFFLIATIVVFFLDDRLARNEKDTEVLDKLKAIDSPKNATNTQTPVGNEGEGVEGADNPQKLTMNKVDFRADTEVAQALKLNRDDGTNEIEDANGNGNQQ